MCCCRVACGNCHHSRPLPHVYHRSGFPDGPAPQHLDSAPCLPSGADNARQKAAPLESHPAQATCNAELCWQTAGLPSGARHQQLAKHPRRHERIHACKTLGTCSGHGRTTGPSARWPWLLQHLWAAAGQQAGLWVGWIHPDPQDA
jgi:hypothetical protein